MTSRVPTHVEHAFTPRETGGYGGRDHIVVEQPLTAGRIRRAAGDALCKPAVKFWGLQRSSGTRPASCARCIALAERLGL
jgi:hypothetical protein